MTNTEFQTNSQTNSQAGTQIKPDAKRRAKSLYLAFRAGCAARVPLPFLTALVLVVGIGSVGVSQPPPVQESATGSQEIAPASPQGPTLRGDYDLSSSGVSVQPEPSPIAKVGAAGDMIGFSHSDTSGTQTITIVHTEKSWMAVYHIDRSGTIRLVSSRPMDADFSLQLNATSPLPDEIRQIGRR